MEHVLFIVAPNLHRQLFANLQSIVQAKSNLCVCVFPNLIINFKGLQLFTTIDLCKREWTKKALYLVARVMSCEQRYVHGSD